MLQDSMLSSINLERQITQMLFQNSGYVVPVSYTNCSAETHEGFATIQQVTTTFFLLCLSNNCSVVLFYSS